jgi:hypothetical protein
MPPDMIAQRRALLTLNQALLEKEFNEQMDKLVEVWANFREAEAENVPG